MFEEFVVDVDSMGRLVLGVEVVVARTFVCLKYSRQNRKVNNVFVEQGVVAQQYL